MDERDIGGVIFGATGGAHPLDVAFIAEEDQAEPWKSPLAPSRRLPGRWRSSCAAAHVGGAPARVSRNGLPGAHLRGGASSSSREIRRLSEYWGQTAKRPRATGIVTDAAEPRLGSRG
jgi:hypothetical protein